MVLPWYIPKNHSTGVFLVMYHHTAVPLYSWKYLGSLCKTMVNCYSVYVNVIHSPWIMVPSPNVLFIFKVFTRYLIETPLHYYFLSVNRSASDKSSLCRPLGCVRFQSPVYLNVTVGLMLQSHCL